MSQPCRFTRNVVPIPLPKGVDPPSLSLEEVSAGNLTGELRDVPIIDIPDVMQFLFEPSRYKVAYGGRGGVKSWSFARALLIKGAQSYLRILCAREFQTSIKESVHQLLSDQIGLIHLQDYYQIFNTEIKGVTGTEFIFAGLKNNVTKIKSTEGIDICWVEEAEKVSNNSWQILIPTIRKENSEIWISFNPHLESDPTYKRFITNPPPNSIVKETGWKDNPWLPKELQEEKDYLARTDKDAYDHVWGGQTTRKSKVQVMHDKCILDNFVPGLDWNGPYYGADWGFASDPATLLKCWVYGRRLFVEEEFWGIGVELDDLPNKFGEVSGSKDHIIRADSARPETISYMKRHGFPKMMSVRKWEGSVEDGISFLRAFEMIVIHPRCVHTDEESRTYKHKVDSLTGDVLPDIIDKNNHCWDPIRYAMDPLIAKKGVPGVFFVGSKMKEQHEQEKENGTAIVAFSDSAIRGGEGRRAAHDNWIRGE